MSWLLAFLGFAALIILHELGHFAVAKAVGMRVERFSLFFPPHVWKRQGKGETEYAIGVIPLGGYVKISGMSPHEELPPEVAHRAYHRQDVWRRVVVILAGPVVNLVLAFLILVGIFLANGIPRDDIARVQVVDQQYPAAGKLRPGDRILAVDGRTGRRSVLSRQIASHKCEGRQRAGCRAATPATFTIERDGRRLTVQARPIYDEKLRKTRVGFSFAPPVFEDIGPIHASGEAVSQMWRFTSGTVSVIAQLFKPEKREQINGVVGSYETTRQAVISDVTTAFYVLALISLSLGVINLFPFLPLDGGHIFWALAEKVRGRAIPFSVMERAGFVGFALVLFLFFIGLSNDIEQLQNGGFDLSR